MQPGPVKLTGSIFLELARARCTLIVVLYALLAAAFKALLSLLFCVLSAASVYDTRLQLFNPTYHYVVTLTLCPLYLLFYVSFLLLEM